MLYATKKKQRNERSICINELNDAIVSHEKKKDGTKPAQSKATKFARTLYYQMLVLSENYTKDCADTYVYQCITVVINQGQQLSNKMSNNICSLERQFREIGDTISRIKQHFIWIVLFNVNKNFFFLFLFLFALVSGSLALGRWEKKYTHTKTIYKNKMFCRCM